jgi:uncharacterized damage-inducible protein DinB
LATLLAIGLLATPAYSHLMTWIAPQTQRAQPPAAADEISTLVGFLDFHRTTFLWKCSGLTGEQLALRSVSSSAMSLLGLLRHLTDVERHWYRDVVAGEAVTFYYWGNPDRDSDFDDADPASAERDYQRFLDEIEFSRQTVRDRDLDALVGEEERNSLRWVMNHMIEEYARHNGHADLFREAIDGEAGE